MITAQINEPFVILDVAYPIEITNLDVMSEAIVTLTGNQTMFSQSTITVPPAGMIIVYASTSAYNDMISISNGSTTLHLNVTAQDFDELDYGTNSYITTFESPADQEPLPPNKFATWNGRIVRFGQQILIQLAEIEEE